MPNFKNNGDVQSGGSVRNDEPYKLRDRVVEARLRVSICDQ